MYFFYIIQVISVFKKNRKLLSRNGYKSDNYWNALRIKIYKSNVDFTRLNYSRSHFANPSSVRDIVESHLWDFSQDVRRRRLEQTFALSLLSRTDNWDVNVISCAMLLSYGKAAQWVLNQGCRDNDVLAWHRQSSHNAHSIFWISLCVGWMIGNRSTSDLHSAESGLTKEQSSFSTLMLRWIGLTSQN